MSLAGGRVALDTSELSDEMRLFAAMCGITETEFRADMERIIARHLARYYFAERLLEHLAGPLTILDAACGSGYGSYILSGRGLVAGRTTIGIDLDPDAVDYASRQFTRPELALEFRTADCRALPWNAPTFDLIASFETLEHISREDGDVFVEQLAGLLRPGGVLLISTPEPRPELDNPFHIHEYTQSEFEALLAAYFPHRRLFTQGFISGSAILPTTDATEAAAVDNSRERLNRSAPQPPFATFCPPHGGVAPAPFVRHYIAVCGHDPLPEAIAPAIICFEPMPGNVTADHFVGA